MNKSISIYTDGSCLGNPGAGGWAAIMRYQETERVLSGGFARTTNNRMEILGVVEALSTLNEPCSVEIYTDSRYVCDAIEKRWIDNWQKNCWRTAAKKPVKNQDLWERMLPLLQAHQVRFHWLRGHVGHPENERCDALARSRAAEKKLPIDTGFEHDD